MAAKLASLDAGAVASLQCLVRSANEVPRCVRCGTLTLPRICSPSPNQSAFQGEFSLTDLRVGGRGGIGERGPYK